MSHEYYMNQAYLQAEIAYEMGEIPVGAVVVANQKIIAKAHNQTEQLQDVTAHAEILAITAAANYLGSKYLPACTLYVTLEPCVMCAGAIAWAQIGTLVYGAGDEKRGFSQINQGKGILHPKTKVVKDIFAQPCQEILQQFFQDLRN
ncbi:MAG: nucleoside deaminase [Microscillaceae bacterium]|jgi:tRNA(adenine34) deaminase|nr:nucleoside deaminase [Microscillaceae bacterium]